MNSDIDHWEGQEVISPASSYAKDWDSSSLAQKFAVLSEKTFKIIATSEKGNCVCCPLGFLFLMSFLSEGIANPTHSSMREKLGISSNSGFWPALNILQNQLTAGSELKLASLSLFDQVIKPEEMGDAFHAAIKKLAHHELIHANFRDRNLVSQINSWAGRNTNWQINEVIQEIPNDSLLLSLQATHFFSYWGSAFEEELEKGVFVTEVDRKALPFMTLKGSISYFENDDVRGFRKFFLNDQFFADFVLPRDLRISPVEVLPVLEDIKIFNRATKVKMPPLDMNTCLGFTKYLDILGFSDFTALPNFHEQAVALDIIQVGRLTIERKFAQASAVTFAAVGASVAQPPETIEPLIFDRPYAIRISSAEFGLPIFYGHIVDPEVPCGTMVEVGLS